MVRRRYFQHFNKEIYNENTKKNSGDFDAFDSVFNDKLFRLHGTSNTARKHSFGGAV